MSDKNNRVSIGVIGFGHWGPNYVRHFCLNRDTAVKTVCDLDQNRAEALQELSPQSAFTRDPRVILEDKDIDCVVVATPAATHYTLVKDALNAGKNVLCEKPLCDSSAKAAELVELAERKNRILAVGHVFRYNTGIQEVADRVAKGEIGKIYYIHLRHTNLGPIRPDVNVVWDLAPHAVSIFFHIFQSWPEEVIATGTPIFNNQREDFAFISLRFPGNILCHLHVSWIEPRKVRQMVVVGEKKMIIWDDVGINPLEIHEKSLAREAFYRDFGEFQLIPKVGPTYLPVVARSEPLKNLCRDFVESVITGKEPLVGGEEGVKNTAVIEAINKSLASGGKPVVIEYP